MSDEPKEQGLSQLPPLDSGVLDAEDHVKDENSIEKQIDDFALRLSSILEQFEGGNGEKIISDRFASENKKLSTIKMRIVEEDQTVLQRLQYNFVSGLLPGLILVHAQKDHDQADNIIKHKLDEDGLIEDDTFEAVLSDLAERWELDPLQLSAAMKQNQVIEGEIVRTPHAEIMPPEEPENGMSRAENDLYERMHNISNSIMFAALSARVPMHMAPTFTYGRRDEQNIGGFAVQSPGNGYDSNVITYTTNIDERAKTITISPKQEQSFTIVGDENQTAEVISDKNDDEIVAALGADGLVSDETLRLFVDDVAEKMNISGDKVWDFVTQAHPDDRIIDFDTGDPNDLSF